MSLRLVLRLHRATHAVGLTLERAPGLDVTQAEAHVLAHLREEGVSTVARIHRAFGHKRSTLTSILDRLAARSLIIRETAEHDRRSFAIRLTPRGRAMAAKVERVLVTLEKDILASASDRDIAGFDRVTALISEYGERSTGVKSAERREKRES